MGIKEGAYRNETLSLLLVKTFVNFLIFFLFIFLGSNTLLQYIDHYIITT